MSKHTPGPWDIGYAQGNDIVIVGLEGVVEICTVWSDPDACDARLIAAAPELLEALKVAACEIADWGSYASEYFQNKHDLQGAISRAKAAIAKATGETNE